MTQQIPIAPNNLTEIMDARMVGDTELSEAVDVARETINRYRNHKRNIPPHNIEKICKALDIGRYQLYVNFQPANDTPDEVA